MQQQRGAVCLLQLDCQQLAGLTTSRNTTGPRREAARLKRGVGGGVRHSTSEGQYVCSSLFVCRVEWHNSSS